MFIINSLFTVALLISSLAALELNPRNEGAVHLDPVAKKHDLEVLLASINDSTVDSLARLAQANETFQLNEILAAATTHGHHMEENPEKISRVSKRWWLVTYSGIIVGSINLLASIFIFVSSFPAYYKLKAEEEHDAQAVVATGGEKGLEEEVTEMDYLERDETVAEAADPKKVNTTFNSHLALEEAHRNAKRFSIYTSATDCLITALVLVNLAYTLGFDHTWRPAWICSGLGFVIFALIQMDCIFVAYEAILSYLAVCAPTKNKHKGRYHWKVWVALIVTPWLGCIALLAVTDSYGSDVFWCFVCPSKAREAMITMLVVHYTVLVIVVMTYFPTVAIRPKIPVGYKPSALAKARMQEVKVTGYHLLVHIMHYTPGTIHAFASFVGYHELWVYVFTLVTLQTGAILHFIIVLVHWNDEAGIKKKGGHH